MANNTPVTCPFCGADVSVSPHNANCSALKTTQDAMDRLSGTKPGERIRTDTAPALQDWMIN